MVVILFTEPGIVFVQHVVSWTNLIMEDAINEALDRCVPALTSFHSGVQNIL